MDTPKTIGIDARFYAEAGPGRYVKNIVSHLEKADKKNNYVIFLRQKGFDLYEPKNPNFLKVLADYQWYTFSEQIGFLFTLLKHKLDLFYVPHFNIPVLYPKKLVTAIPDLIMHTFSTEKGTTLFKPYYKFKKFIYKIVFWWAVLRSKRVIVPSNDVKGEFIDHFPKMPVDKFVIATEGFDPDFSEKDADILDLQKEFSINKPYLLYISSMYEHKNVPRLLEAFKLLIEKYNFGGQLVMVGKKDKYSEEAGQKVKEMGLESKVIFPGLKRYITDDETVALRKNALAYVFPSLKEGFSLTPLEAQYFNLPCVISSIPCHTEIYGDSVMYFDPKNVQDMANKINKLVSDLDLQKRLVLLGRENLNKYSWDNTAEVTLDVFNNSF